MRGLGKPKDLREQLYDPGMHKRNGYLWREVDSLKVIQFMRNYSTHPSSFRVVSPLIADFIQQMNKGGELSKWTVALVGVGGDADEKQLGGHSIKMLKR